MEWWILLVLPVGAFFWWRHTKNVKAARIANERLDKDTRLLQHIKAGLREIEWKRREEGLMFPKDRELLLETTHMAAYNVSHFAESRTGFYFKDIKEYGLPVPRIDQPRTRLPRRFQIGEQL